jgi:hypothetical protein
MKFTSVKDTVEYLDIGALRDKIQVGGGIAARAYGSEEIARNADDLLHFVDSYELKRELEAELAESSAITLPDEELLGDYFDTVVLRRLYESSKARKARRGNVIEMQKR